MAPLLKDLRHFPFISERVNQDILTVTELVLESESEILYDN